MFTSIFRRAHQWTGPANFILSLLLTLNLLTTTVCAQIYQDVQLLELKKPIERELSGGQSHSYRIVLIAGQFLRVVADQRGIDVVLTLFGPDEKQIIEVDSPNGMKGPEPVAVIAATSGNHRLEVRSLEKDAAAGLYQVKIEELRTATERDKTSIAAERVFTEAEQLREQRTAESLQRAIKKYEETLPLFRSIGAHNHEARALNNIGLIYGLLSDEPRALDYYEQALRLRRSIGDRGGEAVSLGNVGRAYDALGQKQKALEYYTQALPIYQSIGDRQGEAGMFNNIGLLYTSLGDLQKALDHYKEALKLVHAIGDSKNEAVILNNIGHLHDQRSEYQKALDYYQQALKVIRLIGDLRNEATMLHNIGSVYHSTGEIVKSLEYLELSLSVLRTAGNRRGEATTLSSIGGLYSSLGEVQKALEYYEQALALVRDIKDRTGEAVVLSSIGKIYVSRGESQKALEYFHQALPVSRELGDRVVEAATLSGIGVSYASLNEWQRAFEYFVQALPIIRGVGDRHGEAILLYNIGGVYASMGERPRALRSLIQALSLNRVTGNRAEQAKVLDKLMSLYHSQKDSRLAIFYGKQAANIYQQLRSSIHTLDADLQKTYLRSVERTYRALGELLISSDRPSEAQQVLNAFKDQQYFDFDESPSKLTPLTHTRREADYLAQHEKAIETLAAIDEKTVELKRRLGNRQPTEEEARQLRVLEAQLVAPSDEIFNLLRQAEKEFSKPVDDKDQVDRVSDTTQMQAALSQLKKGTGQTAVAVYTLVGETKFYALIITADDITSVSSNIKGKELNHKARQLWALLQSDTYDPKVLSHDLYNIVFNPITEKLPVDTKTILWSLDGNLRYLPMAALYDGKQYLVERYNHVSFTRADRERMTRAPSRQWSGLGLGNSKEHTVELLGSHISFGALPGVDEELRAVFRGDGRAGGVLEGEVLPDEKFTKSAMLAGLGQRRPVVHIASHFSFRPGDETRSFLLLGDGSVLTLAEMKAQKDLFGGVELLTLSACNTAAQQADADGREIDAFAELAQRLGANAVMATLWPLADESAPWLMQEFYNKRQVCVGMMKAEALRQAQLALLRGSARISASNRARQAAATDMVVITAKGQRSQTRADVVYVEAKNAPAYKRDRKKPYAHPYYWAPVILIGNLR